MKRWILLISVMAILFALCACQSDNEDIQQPVNFYYHRDLTSQEDFDSVIVSEIRESAGYTTEALLEQYLAGPVSVELQNPFPDGLSVISLIKEDKRVVITLSRQLIQISGIDLTLVCTCLSSTLFEMYDCQEVEIFADGLLIDGKASIVVRKDDLVMLDGGYSDQDK